MKGEKQQRVVVKLGTNILSKEDGLNIEFLNDIASQIASIIKKGALPMIVSSGAIGIGAAIMGVKKRVKKINYRQAYAAIGQPMLMNQYQKAFEKFNIPIAQVLVTKDIFNQREAFLNLRTAVETLLEEGVVPIFNENDSVSTDEIGTVFGDNDTLSGHVASKLDADLLILLTDIDALYTSDPKTDSNAKPIHEIVELTEEVMAMAGKAGSEFSTGGMATKLRAVEIAQPAGCQVVIAHGHKKDILCKIYDGENIGTRFLAGEKKQSRHRWILNSDAQGSIIVDDGALKALDNRKSLLPSGVVKVIGQFHVGDVVMINDKFKAVTNIASTELIELKGKHSSEIQKILGPNRRDDIARPEDIVAIR